jgi:hypothetical protein
MVMVDDGLQAWCSLVRGEWGVFTREVSRQKIFRFPPILGTKFRSFSPSTLTKSKPKLPSDDCFKDKRTMPMITTSSYSRRCLRPRRAIELCLVLDG